MFPLKIVQQDQDSNSTETPENLEIDNDKGMKYDVKPKVSLVPDRRISRAM